LKIICLIAGLAIAAWGGVILYRLLWLEPRTTLVITDAEVHQYPNLLRLAGGIILLAAGAGLAFISARRKRP
jgi:hypothetical protein